MMKYVYPVTPVCIVFDYSRTLAQKEFPVGLRSLLIREYGDDWICPYISRHLRCTGNSGHYHLFFF
ncbi:hypothetical protein [Shigella sonnei]|uniref:hypothetical protein n=1 Tax=Shigella sonnei TaxID=624 RepID=UPI00097D1415|nr:hypothetical protein [Shigella sonnei]